MQAPASSTFLCYAWPYSNLYICLWSHYCNSTDHKSNFSYYLIYSFSCQFQSKTCITFHILSTNLYVVQLGNNAWQVPHSIPIGVVEAWHKHLIHDGSLPPCMGWVTLRPLRHLGGGNRKRENSRRQ